MCSGDPKKYPIYESLMINLEPNLVEIYEDGECYALQCVDICQKFNIPCEAYIITEKIIENELSGSMSVIISR